MKKKLFWVDLRTFDKKLLIAAIEVGADAVFIPDGESNNVKKLGKITTISKDGDLKIGTDVEIIKITNKSDEDKAAAFMGKIPVIIENIGWTIIPLENLISKTSNLIQSVSNPEETKLALEIMERGADGVLLKPQSVNDILETGRIIQEFSSEKFKLETVKITKIKPVSMSDRCSVDTSSILPKGRGLLVGNHSSAMFLVHNENIHGLYCAARPFRVNAGAVHAYIRVPGDRTKYLYELSIGDEVLAVDPNGDSHVVTIGRNKIERRPMLLVVGQNKDGRQVSLILQNAETIRLTTEKGEIAPVTELKEGDSVLAYFGELIGRHFGEPIKETIHEK